MDRIIDIQDEQEKNILAIIPAYNEQLYISQTIIGIRELGEHIDIIVIDDGSKDSTSTVVKLAGASIIRHTSNMGYGVALQTGYKYAFENGYDYLVQLDADGQHDPKYIPDLLKILILKEADIILGSRFLKISAPGKRLLDKYRGCGARRLGIGLFSFLTSKLIGLQITDPTSGYQAFNKKIISFFVQDFFPCDYPDADVIVMVHRAGFKIKELPMIMRERYDGKSMHSGLKPFYYVFKMFLSMFMVLIRKRPTL